MIDFAKAEFIKSAPGLKFCPDDSLPEVAFIGRSNVGKSSLINYLVNRKALAKTSSTPGRTQAFNYYLIDNKLYFVDFPGYGYAKVGKAMRSMWEKERERFLRERQSLRAVVLVVDIRHEISKLDQEMANLLMTLDVPVFTVLTKADKLSRQKQMAQMSYYRKLLPWAVETVIAVSSEKKQGREPLLKSLAKLVE